MYCRCLSSTDIRAEVADVVQRSYEFSSLAGCCSNFHFPKTLCTRHAFDKALRCPPLLRPILLVVGKGDVDVECLNIGSVL